MQWVDTDDGLLGAEIHDKLSRTLPLGISGDFVAIIVTAEIGDGGAVSLCDSSLGDDLSGIIVSLVSSFSS